MKKITILMIAVAMMFAGNTYAQVEQGTIRANVGLNYMFKPFDGDARLGLGLGGEYLITDAISLAPSYYFSNKNSVKLNTFNIDARYYFMNEATQVYGVIGYQSIKIKSDFAGGSLSQTETGLALGAGAIFGLSDSMGINTELKYGLTSPGDDAFGLLGKVGVVFSF